MQKKLPYEDEVVKLWLEGYTIKELAFKFGLSRPSIIRRIDRNVENRRRRATNYSTLCKEAIELYSNGFSLKEISEFTKMPKSTVSRYLKNNGVELRKKGYQHGMLNPRSVTYHESKQFARMYVEEGLNVREISERTGMHRTSIVRRLKKAGVWSK